MLYSSRLFKSNLSVRNSFKILVPFLLLMTAFPSFGAELFIQYEQITRSGVTPIPDGVGTFTGFGGGPAIDDSGNVVFVGGGGDDINGEYQAGVYTFIDGNYQMVADRNTLVPRGGGATFDLFAGAERNDIDDGRVAFTAKASPTELLYGLYSNVGQADPNDLVEVLLLDGDEWSSKGDPYIDGDVVSVRGRRLIPEDHTTILLWDGWDSSSSFVDPGAGYIVSPGTQPSISGDAVMFNRYKTGSSEMGIFTSNDGIYETLAVLNSTPMPGLEGSNFKYFKNFPAVDRDGLDAAFLGSDGTISGVFKRTDGGALENVADTQMVIPGTTPIPFWGDQIFISFPESGLSLANGKLVFLGNGINSLEGIYTDIGGNLSVIVDVDENNSIELGAQTEQITDLEFGTKSFAYTPEGYMIIFKARFESGEDAIIRATIDAPPGGGTDSFTVYKDFSDNNPDSVSVSLSCSSGTVTNNPQWAAEVSPAVFNITGATGGTTCTAAESVPSGYTANQSDCQNGDPVNGSCTIVNTLDEVPVDNFTVFKDFSDNNSASVSITLSCSHGTVTNNPQFASEASPAVFDITGSNPSSKCTATENSVPPGYTVNESECHDVPLIAVGGCEIFNTAAEPSDDMLFRGGFED